MFLKIFTFSLLFTTFLLAQKIQLNDKDSKISILEHAHMYIDKTSKLQFKEIQEKKFYRTNTNYLKLGYTEDALWVKFSIKNNSNKKQVRYLTITNNMLDTIILYTKTDYGYKKEIQGLLNQEHYDKNNLLFSNFKINFKAGETKEFYYKTHSLSCANYYKLYLKDHTKLYEDEFNYQLIEVLFAGAMFALIFYNLFIFYFTKEKTYLYYLLYMIFITWNHVSYTSLSTYLIPIQFAEIEAYLAAYYIGFSNIFALLFIYTILEIKHYKKLSFIIYLIIFLNIILMIISLLGVYLIEYIAILIFFSMIFLLFLCFYSYSKNHRQAKYLLIGWAFNVAGIMMLALKDYGFWTIIDTLPYFYEVTTFLEAILFSVALASKLNRNKELESSLKTNKILTKELHHRVKNNMQFIILMYRLKLAKLTNTQIDEQLTETEGSIQAISKTHEILYNQDNLETINTQLYFKNLIKEFKRSFNIENIKINIDINNTLDTQKAIYCGIILNELITNSLKYAFKENHGKIDISLNKENNKYKFLIQDNGIGFDYESKQNDSFGLSFVKAMVEDELKGNIHFKNSSGTSITIIFK